MQQLQLRHPSEIGVGGRLNHAGAAVEVQAIERMDNYLQFTVVCEDTGGIAWFYTTHDRLCCDQLLRYEEVTGEQPREINDRFVVEISLRKIDANGDDLKEWGGLTLELAASDSEPLDAVMEQMYEVGMTAMRDLRGCAGVVISDRRPDDKENDDVE